MITRSKNIITQFLILFYERRYVEICTSIKIHSPAPPEVFAKFSPLTKCKHHLEKHLSSYLKSTRIEGGFHRSDNWLSCRNTSIIILFSNKILQHFAQRVNIFSLSVNLNLLALQLFLLSGRFSFLGFKLSCQSCNLSVSLFVKIVFDCLVQEGGR